MTAKEYLGQLSVLNEKIDHRQKQIDELRTMVSSLQSPQLKKDIVQTSHSQDQMADGVSKYIDMELEIAKMIDSYIDLKHRIIGEIHDLSEPKYIALLHARYVDGKRLEQISIELSYSYDWTRELHGAALANFEEIHPEIAIL